MAITLYEAANEVAAQFDLIDPDTGEMPEGYQPAREIVESKGAATIAYIKQREGDEVLLSDAITQLKGKLDAVRKRTGHLRKYLADCMRVAGITEIGNAVLKAKLYIDRDEHVEVYDERQVPAQYMRQPEPPPPKPDKAALKSALKTDPDSVQGARLVKMDRLEIR